MGCAARRPIVERDDVSISNDVRARLAADTQTSPSEITVDTTAGIVHLTGTVATDDERNSIERIARDAPGVRAVDNNVRFGDVPTRVKPTTH
jgi:hyperosmotically inducible protein